MSLKVLLADDSMTAQNMGKKILAESGYEVTTVSNGAAAVKKIAEVKPDVVILDIYMPGYTGLEVCERVRANLDTANLPVLLTVGKMEPYRAEDGAKVRADGVIVKPFEATDLLAVVKKMAEKAAPAIHVAAEETASAEEEIGQPEPAMPAAVEVPSEMASAPAFVMDEFSAAPAQAPEPKPPIEWSPVIEAPVEQAISSTLPEQKPAEIPWSFDEPAMPVESQSETVAKPEPGVAVEFTAAPQIGEVEVRQAEGLENGFHEASLSGDLQIGTDPALTGPQEITEFATSFGVKSPEPPPEETSDVIAALPTIESPAESAWDGWANAQPAPTAEAFESPSEPAAQIEAEATPEATPAVDDFEAKVAAAMAGFSAEPQSEATVETQESAPVETLSSPNVNDFDARVAAAMSGFGTEPVEAAHAISEEAHAQPAEIEAVADDFEARVAAAMSGFATEPVEAEPVAEIHAQPVAETHLEPAAVEAPAEAVATPATEQDDFDARLAQALSAFDTASETPSEVQPAMAAPTEPAAVPPAEAPSVDLNETMVLPHEALLSLEEEMKRALGTHPDAAEEIAEAHAGPVAEAHIAETEEMPSPEPGPQPEIASEAHAASNPAGISELDSAHMTMESAPPQLPEEAVAAFAAAATAESAEVEKVATPNPSSDNFADAVHRAIERLKPQLIAEIVKELKGE